MSNFAMFSAMQNSKIGFDSAIQSLASTFSDSAKSVVKFNSVGANALSTAVLTGALSAKGQFEKVQSSQFISGSKEMTSQLAGKVQHINVLQLANNGKAMAALLAQRVWNDIHLKKMVDEAVQWIRDNPKTAAAIGVGLVLVGGYLLMPAIVNAAGFTAAGVQAGTLAPAIQSAFYGGATGGLFSALQAYGAVTVPLIAPTIIGAISVSSSAAMAAVILAQKRLKTE